MLFVNLCDEYGEKKHHDLMSVVNMTDGWKKNREKGHFFVSITGEGTPRVWQK